MSEAPVPAPSSRIRIGDDERDRAIAALRAHHSAGRLTFAEFADRMSAALEARTGGDLEILFEDLPAAARPTAPPSVPTGRPLARTPKTVLFGALVAAAIATAGTAAISHGSAVSTSSPAISYRWKPSMTINAGPQKIIAYRWAWTFRYSTAVAQHKLPGAR